MTTTSFGPQLIGETEKTLNALLARHLDGTGLTEPLWVTLRVATQLDGTVDDRGLAAAVAGRARYADAPALVRTLTTRGVLDGGRTTAAGRALLGRVQAALASDVTAVFSGLPADDVAAATRVLTELVTRARQRLV